MACLQFGVRGRGEGGGRADPRGRPRRATSSTSSRRPAPTSRFATASWTSNSCGRSTETAWSGGNRGHPSVDPGRVQLGSAPRRAGGAERRRAGHGVGLDGHTNTSCPRGLAALVTGPSPYAVIDVGTNSVKFHVGERHPDGNWRAIADRAEVTRLGENLEHVGAISAEPLDLARLDGRPRPDALVAMAVR